MGIFINAFIIHQAKNVCSSVDLGPYMRNYYKGLWSNLQMRRLRIRVDKGLRGFPPTSVSLSLSPIHLLALIKSQD